MIFEKEQGKQSGNVLEHFLFSYLLQNCFENFKFDFVSNFLVPFGLVCVCFYVCKIMEGKIFLSFVMTKKCRALIDFYKMMVFRSVKIFV
jgi:hypothetical protein